MFRGGGQLESGGGRKVTRADHAAPRGPGGRTLAFTLKKVGAVEDFKQRRDVT